MARSIDWQGRIGRHLRLRDLHVFLAVVQSGSMAKAAMQLRVTQPAVSKAIGDLETALGVRLFDRSPQGTRPTMYGDALLNCGSAVFDELRQGIRNIEFLADPNSGEVRIGCGVAPAATILPPILQRFAQSHPRVVLHVNEVPPPTQELSGLLDRTYDLILGRWVTAVPHDPHADEINVEVLFDDRLVVAVGMQNRWADRRKVDLAELVNDRWILASPNTLNHKIVAEAFRARGLAMPKSSLVTLSVHVRTDLLAGGQFITALPRSLADRYNLKVLPVDFPTRPSPVVIITLKNRTLSPVVERFIECAREIAKSLALRPQSRKS
jgi:DNA-binding transcriptional LysR family regulator